MTAPATVAKPKITLDRRAPSRHDSTLVEDVMRRMPGCSGMCATDQILIRSKLRIFEQKRIELPSSPLLDHALLRA
jgi:hypothetical protein